MRKRTIHNLFAGPNEDGSRIIIGMPGRKDERSLDAIKSNVCRWPMRFAGNLIVGLDDEVR